MNSGYATGGMVYLNHYTSSIITKKSTKYRTTVKAGTMKGGPLIKFYSKLNEDLKTTMEVVAELVVLKLQEIYKFLKLLTSIVITAS